MIITKDILNEKVPKEMIPTRLDSAMNLYTNVTYAGNSGIIVYNVLPDIWNCLYPFYELNHKFTLDEYKFQKEDITYKELIEEYQKVYKEIYENEKGNIKSVRIETLINEYKETFSLNNVHIGGELSPIFELKYSKSKNVWTIYYFENYIVDRIDNVNDLLKQKLYEQKILPLDSNIKEIDGVDIISNLPYLLSIESNVEKLKNNLIEVKNNMIDKVGGIILKDKKILVQRKKNNREECIIPGGKRETGESDFETLKRELMEELTVELVGAEFIGGYDDIACFSNKPIHVQAYLVTYTGEIKCANEIKEAIWIDRNYKEKRIKVGSILGEHIIPELIKKGLM